MMICEPHIWGRGADLLKYLYEMMQLEIKVLKYAKINILSVMFRWSLLKEGPLRFCHKQHILLRCYTWQFE